MHCILKHVGVLTIGLCGLIGRAIAEEIRPDYAMYADPVLEGQLEGSQLQDGIVDLWQQALARPEADYQRLGAEAIAEAADEQLPGLEPAQPLLRQILSHEDSHPAAVHAAARALIALQDDQSAAELLAAGQKYGQSLRLLVEPALADWGFAPIAAHWRERLQDPQAGRRDLVLALEGLARLQDQTSLEPIRKFVHSSDQSADVRLASARAAGTILDSGLEMDVSQLSDDPRAGLLPRLLSVALLQRHQSPKAIEQLQRLAGDAEPTVAEPALARLLEIDPQLALSLAERAMRTTDPKLRRRGSEVYLALPTIDRLPVVADLLDDPHPDVRGSVRDGLYEVAEQPDLRARVFEEGLRILNGPSWRGQEQAALLLGALDHEPAAPRLLELLAAERPEVMVATAWALRKLAVEQTRGPILEHVQSQTKLRLEQPQTAGLDRQVAHLFEALAIMNETQVEPLLREYIPKRGAYGHDSRGAAIWTLGLFHAGAPDEALASQLMGRLNDSDPIDPELEIVWEMSAVTLGRMQARSQEAALQERLKVALDRTKLAIRWALEQITGEALPPFEPVERYKVNWFLEPLGGPSTTSEEP